MHRAALEALGRQDFEGLVGDVFTMRLPEANTASLRLIEVSPGGDPAGRERRPFSLVFRGPTELVAPQRIYTLRHEGLGALEVFLVPIGPDGSGMRYEAVFG